LRAFLEKESPVKYTSTEDFTANKPSTPPPASKSTTAAAAARIPAHQQQHRTDSNCDSDATSDHNASAKVPTLFPEDNRYAHLWKTYKPLAELTAASASPQEKLSDVLSGYQERKASIGRAALENCADEQWAQNECWRGGTWKQRATLCRDEVRRLERCYVMNARFLKALGYLSVWDRPAEEEERIQMHADKLYHDMLHRERVEEEARRWGSEAVVPQSGDSQSAAAAAAAAATAAAAANPAPVTTTTTTTAISTTSTGSGMGMERSGTNSGSGSGEEPVTLPAIAANLPPKIRDKFRDRLKKLGPLERAVEEQAIAREIQAAVDVSKSVEQVMRSNAEEKARRVESGQATVGDRIGSLFGR
jgi:hypothetical protein